MRVNFSQKWKNIQVSTTTRPRMRKGAMIFLITSTETIKVCREIGFERERERERLEILDRECV
jgi:hypothetical protein